MNWRFFLLMTVSIVISVHRVSAMDEMDERAVLMPIMKDDSVRVQELIRAGLSPCCTFQFGRTMLHMAAYHDAKRTADFLLGCDGIDPDAKDEDGDTPLHIAVTFNRLLIIKMLIAKGADPHLRDNDGKSSLDKSYGASRLLSILIKT